jgi:hypothetical protein
VGLDRKDFQTVLREAGGTETTQENIHDWLDPGLQLLIEEKISYSDIFYLFIFINTTYIITFSIYLFLTFFLLGLSFASLIQITSSPLKLIWISKGLPYSYSIKLTGQSEYCELEMWPNLKYYPSIYMDDHGESWELQSGEFVSGPRSEPGSLSIQSSCAAHLTTFGYTHFCCDICLLKHL